MYICVCVCVCVYVCVFIHPSQYHGSIPQIRHFILALEALTHTLKINLHHASLSQDMLSHQNFPDQLLLITWLASGTRNDNMIT